MISKIPCHAPELNGLDISSPAHHADYESRVKRLGRQLGQQLIILQGSS
jgi:hypothetical protein